MDRSPGNNVTRPPDLENARACLTSAAETAEWVEARSSKLGSMAQVSTTWALLGIGEILMVIAESASPRNQEASEPSCSAEK